ncbi:hypothetical protein HPB52_010028 [Rhipicephalus sanguineus]|uniref:Uncharacterized protein n=1 Tax=Rhipicephalus sanguineus TaxID=34632 RepID=A0A9D4SSW3_RHISA|nr:hypothetical protein HPB52_010028 [Rhipicephalus sanguineus]
MFERLALRGERLVVGGCGYTLHLLRKTDAAAVAAQSQARGLARRRTDTMDVFTRDYDAADWTTIFGTYRGKSQSKARTKDLPEASEKQKAPEERTETLTVPAWRPTYRPNPAQLRATQQVTRRSRQMAPLLQHAIKVICRSQGGLFMPNIQTQLVLRCLCATAKIPLDTEVQIRVHPTNNTCTVARTNHETALNLVKIRSITFNAKAYVIAAYIASAAETVRGVISNAFWDETEEELLQEVQARNPEAGILLSRRMGKPKDLFPVESSTMGECTCTRHTERDQKPAHTAEPLDTDMMCARNRRNRDVQGAVKITGKIEVVIACPDAFSAAESTLREPGGVKQNSDRSQRSHQPTGNLPGDSSCTKRASQDGIHQPHRRPPRSSHGQNESPVNQTPWTTSWPPFGRRQEACDRPLPNPHTHPLVTLHS